MSSRFGPEDEARHQPHPGAVDWVEALRLDLVGWSPLPGGHQNPVAVTSQLTIHHEPGRGRIEFAAVLLESNRLPVVLCEPDLDVPVDRWELRGSGIWADQVVEEPLQRWSYGLEAFALAIDDPHEFLTRGLGVRVPLGWELDVEAGELPQPMGEETAWLGYRQVGEVGGILLGGAEGDGTGSANEERELVGTAARSHWWGVGGPARFDVGSPEPAEAPMELLLSVAYPLGAGVVVTTLSAGGVSTTRQAGV